MLISTKNGHYGVNATLVRDWKYTSETRDADSVLHSRLEINLHDGSTRIYIGKPADELLEALKDASRVLTSGDLILRQPSNPPSWCDVNARPATDT